MLRAFAWVLLVLAALPAAADASLRVETVSTRPEMVTGGDVLVRVRGAAPASIVVRVDGRDVTRSFRPRRYGLIGLVGGLDVGRHRPTATHPPPKL
jgi:hypothetical protein